MNYQLKQPYDLKKSYAQNNRNYSTNRDMNRMYSSNSLSNNSMETYNSKLSSIHSGRSIHTPDPKIYNNLKTKNAIYVSRPQSDYDLPSRVSKNHHNLTYTMPTLTASKSYSNGMRLSGALGYTGARSSSSSGGKSGRSK